MKNLSAFLFLILLFTLNHSYSLAEEPKAGEKIINYKPEEVKVINVGPQINTKGLEYAPTLFSDDQFLIFISDRNGSVMQNGRNSSHDFWVAGIIDDTTYIEPFNAELLTEDSLIEKKLWRLNTPYNEGAGCFSNHLQAFIFTGCNRPDGYSDCDIYCCLFKNGKFGPPFNLGPNVNTKYFDSQPSISEKDDKLYFISNRPGPNSNGEPKEENFDIWYCDFDTTNMSWLPAKNLTIFNTEYQETSPCIAPDGVTLFFCSKDIEPNYGGLDFYVTRFNPVTKTWSKPENLGKPINSSEDEMFMTISKKGDSFYFSSRRKEPKGFGNLDIYKVILPRPLIKQ